MGNDDATVGLIKTSDIILPAIVSLIASIQLVFMAKTVGKLRYKFKITYPSMTGDPLFERALRGQQNTVEFITVFLTCMWLSAVFFHPVPAAIVGLVYTFGRHQYFQGYIKSVEGRVFGFHLCVKCLMAFLAMSVLGLLTTLLRVYVGYDLAKTFCNLVHFN